MLGTAAIESVRTLEANLSLTHFSLLSDTGFDDVEFFYAGCTLKDHLAYALANKIEPGSPFPFFQESTRSADQAAMA